MKRLKSLTVQKTNTVAASTRPKRADIAALAAFLAAIADTPIDLPQYTTIGAFVVIVEFEEVAEEVQDQPPWGDPAQ